MKIVGAVLTDATAAAGGSLQFTANSSLHLVDCHVTNATSTDDGGCLSFTDAASLRVSNSSVTKCRAGGNGALAVHDQATATIHDSRFVANYANNGGAIHALN